MSLALGRQQKEEENSPTKKENVFKKNLAAPNQLLTIDQDFD
jgi:hypothetical protein